jgi:16S rRNA (cytosine1402-N4)-methyltransferase
MSEAREEHLPVMLAESLNGLAIRPDGFYVDCTFGRGGHSRAILERLGAAGRLLALDKDPEAVASEAARRLSLDPRFMIVRASYADIGQEVERLGFAGKVAGALMDLGVSSPQLDEAERGFSFLRDGPLDMRMDASRGLTAAEWLAATSERELARALKKYGEERYAGRIARAIVEALPIVSTRHLAQVIEAASPTREKHKHPATRSFQAIRIALNRELEELEAALPRVVEALAPGGRLAVIAFHSLEDRIVKRFMRDREIGAPAAKRLPQPLGDGCLPELKRVGKARMPGKDEMSINVRARSAVLRVAERVAA